MSPNRKLSNDEEAAGLKIGHGTNFTKGNESTLATHALFSSSKLGVGHVNEEYGKPGPPIEGKHKTKSSVKKVLPRREMNSTSLNGGLGNKGEMIKDGVTPGSGIEGKHTAKSSAKKGLTSQKGTKGHSNPQHESFVYNSALCSQTPKALLYGEPQRKIHNDTGLKKTESRKLPDLKLPTELGSIQLVKSVDEKSTESLNNEKNSSNAVSVLSNIEKESHTKPRSARRNPLHPIPMPLKSNENKEVKKSGKKLSPIATSKKRKSLDSLVKFDCQEMSCSEHTIDLLAANVSDAKGLDDSSQIEEYSQSLPKGNAPDISTKHQNVPLKCAGSSAEILPSRQKNVSKKDKNEVRLAPAGDDIAPLILEKNCSMKEPQENFLSQVPTASNLVLEDIKRDELKTISRKLPDFQPSNNMKEAQRKAALKSEDIMPKNSMIKLGLVDSMESSDLRGTSSIDGMITESPVSKISVQNFSSELEHTIQDENKEMVTASHKSLQTCNHDGKKLGSKTTLTDETTSIDMPLGRSKSAKSPPDQSSEKKEKNIKQLQKSRTSRSLKQNTIYDSIEKEHIHSSLQNAEPKGLQPQHKKNMAVSIENNEFPKDDTLLNGKIEEVQEMQSILHHPTDIEVNDIELNDEAPQYLEEFSKQLVSDAIGEAIDSLSHIEMKLSTPLDLSVSGPHEKLVNSDLLSPISSLLTESFEADKIGSNAESTPNKIPRRKPGARECMQISRRFGVNVIPQKYMDTLLDYCLRGKVEHLIRMRERLDEHSRMLESQLAGLEGLVKEKGELDISVPPLMPGSEINTNFGNQSQVLDSAWCNEN